MIGTAISDRTEDRQDRCTADDLIPQAADAIVSGDQLLKARASWATTPMTREWWNVGVADDGTTFLY